MEETVIGPRKLLFAIIFTLAVVGLSSANDVYIAQSAQGGNSGADCADALVYTYFNTSSNWTSGTPSGTKIGPGTTVHLCGTFTGTVGQTLLTFQGSGSSGNPITLLFEAGAILTAPYWSSSGAINFDSLSYITIDGDASGGRQGIIENTLNGTSGASCSGGSCSYQANSAALHFDSASNVIVENLSVFDMYLHTSTSDTSPDANSVNVAHFFTANSITINNILAHDCGNCLNGSGNNNTVSNSEIYNMNQGWAFGAGGVTLSGVYFYGNYFHDYSNWDTTSDTYHHEAVHLFANSGSGLIENSFVYNNVFGGVTGLNVTAHVSMEGSLAAPYFFNNVCSNSGSSYGAPCIIMYDDGGAQTYITTPFVMNNTVLGGSINAPGNTDMDGMQDVQNWTLENNVVTGGPLLVGTGTTVTFASGGLSYNVYENIISDLGATNAFDYQGTFDNGSSAFTSWQKATGQDGNSLYTSISNINLNSSTGQLNAGSVAIGAGKNLYSMCNGQPNPGLGALCYDKAGNARPSSGAWDAGAFSYQTGDPTPSPPTGLTASVQ